MRRIAPFTAPLLLALGALGCATGGAQITDSWLDPSVTSMSFDKVMVMAEQKSLRQARLALLAELRKAMNRVADISKLAQ